jgi:hypothetical protein
VTYVVLLLLGLAAIWWWTSHVPVSPPQVPELSARIPFPALRLDDATTAIAQIDKKDEIVIPHEYATLVIKFPLTKPVSLAVTAPIPEGFTRAALIETICEQYENVYDIEEATSTVKPLPPEERARLGRNRTDGLYGIWGHDLPELVLTAVHWKRSPDARVHIEPHVEPRAKPELTA